MAKVRFKINNTGVDAERGIYVLPLIQKLGIYVPTLCYHPAVKPYGACRLCLIEVKDKRSRIKITTSCNYPAQEGIEIFTDTEKVKRARKLIMEMLLAQASGSEEIKEFAKKLEVEKTTMDTAESTEKCIMCGLCIRVCEELIGLGCLTFEGKGVGRKVTTPWNTSSDLCIGCGACAAVCPTGAIIISDVERYREINKTKVRLPLLKCNECGSFFVVDKIYEKLKASFKSIVKNNGEFLNICEKCKRKLLAQKLIGDVHASQSSLSRDI